MPIATCNGAIVIVWRAGFTGIEPVRHNAVAVYPAKKDLQIDLQVLFCALLIFVLSTRTVGLWPCVRICANMPNVSRLVRLGNFEY